jgi:hypothetical protein
VHSIITIVFYSKKKEPHIIMDRSYCMPYFSGFMAFCAFIITLFGASYCNFLTFSQSVEGVEDPVVLHYGVWWYRGWAAVSTTEGNYILEACFAYNDDVVIDSKWKSARAFSTMALIIGGAASIWSLCAGCLHPSKRMFQASGAVYMLCCFFTGMTLLMLESNACKNNLNVKAFEEAFRILDVDFQDSCSMGAGAKTTIAATVLWFAAAIASCKSEPLQNGPDSRDVAPEEDLAKEEPVPKSDDLAKEESPKSDDLAKEESVPAGESPEQAV